MKKNKLKTKGLANKDVAEKKYVYLTYTEHQSGGDLHDPDDRWSSVYVRYRTGDSFGTTHGAWTIIGVYQHQGQAAKIAEQINLKTYVSPSGYCVWDGYFESLECCEAEGFIVKE